MKCFLKKIKSKIAIWFSNCTCWYIPKRITKRTWRDICIIMSIAALFIISKRWKLPNCPWMDEWISKCRILYNEILFSLKKDRHFDTCYKGMILEDNMLGEIIQSQRTIIYVSPHMRYPKSSQLYFSETCKLEESINFIKCTQLI